MQLTIQDVARLFDVTEKTVARWLRERSLPATVVSEQHRFNRSEVLEWALANGIPIASGLFGTAMDPEFESSIADALEAGGIYYNVVGADKASVLREVVKRMPFSQGA